MLDKFLTENWSLGEKCMGIEVLIILSMGFLFAVAAFLYAAIQLHHQLDRTGRYLEVLVEAVDKIQSIRSKIKRKLQPD